MRELPFDRTGNVIVLVALAFPVLVGAGGLMMDTVHLALVQRQLQRVADSAALAGALARAQEASSSAAANSSIARDNLVTLSGPPVVEHPPTSGAYAGNPAAVRVSIRSSVAQAFSGMFRRRPAELQAQATAAQMTNGSFCVLALEPSAAAGITMQGNAHVKMDCGFATNSKGSPAVSTGGSSNVDITHVSAVGGLRSSVNYASHTVLLPHSIPQRDPYRSLPAPVLPTCQSRLRVQPNTVVNVGNPTGAACYRGMDLKGAVNFAPGVYYIDGGSLSIGSQASVSGNGVTFVLSSATAASNPSSIATLDMNGGATVQLTASTSGVYAGVLFYQDRRALPGTTNSVNGNSLSALQGGIYFASQDLSFSGKSGMTTDCIQIVSRRVTFTGNTSINNVCPSNSGAKSFTGTRVFLVE